MMLIHLITVTVDLGGLKLMLTAVYLQTDFIGP